MNLMSAYTNDELMTREQIQLLPVPPAIGSRHNPISFHDYIEVVAESLDRNGLVIQQEEHLIGHEGQRYFGLMEVGAKEGDLVTASEWKMLIGLRGSHDQSIPRGICAGRQVMVCSNLCFSGDIATMSTKQTLNIWERLPQLIRESVSKIPELAHREERRVEKLKDYELNTRAGDAMLVELMRRNAITSGQISRAAAEWIEPTYIEHAADGFNLYRLEQAVTESIKPTGQSSNFFTGAKRTEIASEFFNELMDF